MDSSKQAQLAVIQFLSAEGVSGTDIYSRMKNVYGTECMSHTAVFRWSSDFCHGRVSTADMLRPGQAHVVIAQESIAAVNSLVRENRRITTREIADKKKALKGRRFTDNDEVRETVEEWFRTQPKTFFADGFHRLVDQWDTCFNQQGDYG